MRSIIFILKGLSGIFIQSIILREIFSNFFGNELSFSIVISFWIFGGAIGSYFFRKIKNYQKIYIFFTILEIIFLFSLLIILRIFLNIKEVFSISNLRFFIFSFFLSFLSGFFEGARFILLSFLYKEEKNSGKVYGLEGIGFLIGGFLFLFLIGENIIFLIFFVSLLNILTIFYFKKNLSFLFLSLFFLFLLSFSKKIDYKTYSAKYKNFKIVEISDTIYNKLILLNKENQYILISNGFQEFTNQPDYFSIKNISFFSVAFSFEIKRIGIYGSPEIIEELAKYKIPEIYFFEKDKEKIEIIKNYFLKKNYKNIFFLNTDVKKFLTKNKLSFDVFIITNSLPLSLKENYFLTDEFINFIYSFTKNLVIILPGNYDYLGKIMSKIHSSIYKTCKKYFKNEIITFTYPMIICFSNEKLKLNKDFILDKEFFNDGYLKYVLDENKKNQYLKKILSGDSYENNLSNQFCLYYSLSYYFSQTSTKIGNLLDLIFTRIYSIRKFIYPIFLILFLLSLMIFPSPYFSIILTNGFSSFTFETIFIFLFQINFGFLYGFISKIIGIFMAGISFGSLISVLKNHGKKEVFYSEVFHFIFYISSFFLLINGKLSIILIFISGFFTGWEFGIISSVLRKENIVEITGKLYSIDLIGTLISSLFLPLFFIPAFGIYSTLLLISVLKLSNLTKIIFHIF